MDLAFKTEKCIGGPKFDSIAINRKTIIDITSDLVHFALNGFEWLPSSSVQLHVQFQVKQVHIIDWPDVFSVADTPILSVDKQNVDLL